MARIPYIFRTCDVVQDLSKVIKKHDWKNQNEIERIKSWLSNLEVNWKIDLLRITKCLEDVMLNIIKGLRNKLRFRESKISLYSRVSRNSEIGKSCVLLADSEIGASTIGRFSYVGRRSRIQRSIIGPFCSIGPDVMSGLGIHPTDFVSTYPGFYSNKASGSFFFGSNHEFEEHQCVEIGPDVWLGARCIITDGVTIGAGAIVAAGAVVTKDVEPYSIVGGVPARHIRFRFENDICDSLLKSRWWDLSEKELKRLSKYSHDIREFIRRI